MTDSYRDDHDAALARIDALQDDLRRMQDELDSARQTTRDTQREADDAKRALEAQRTATPVRPTPAKRRRAPIRDPHPGATPVEFVDEDPATLRATITAFIVMIGLGIAAAVIGGAWALFANATHASGGDFGGWLAISGLIVIALSIAGIATAPRVRP
ncbi:MAG: hypothetical protein QM831_04255 [Kofleriaceae bacterium]